ncbi:histidine--tRNA ligase [Kiritimatiellota bacterium B12222]|nr:histidine--tRNA ligase [Kiritimatiellota bacterium B12222]
MAKVSQSLQGMTDIEFPEVNIWQTLESRAREVMLQYDFKEIRTPIVEMTSVYLHSLGDTSEIVQKQMYAFETRGGKQVCLRPEGTAGVMRYVSNNMQELQDARLYYMGPMFRAERPQAGRKRQFHQLGVECIGGASARQDAEVIALQDSLFKAWELDGVVFQLNTRGSSEDFPKILDGLRSELMPSTDDLCEDCRRRMDNNVLRVLDCKNPGCKTVVEGLSPITTWMAPESVAYFEEVLATLDTFGVSYVVNPLLVRGLDYYQHSIWEVTSDRLGAQDALSGGGRYQMKANGKTIEGVGFGIGMERALMALAKEVEDKFSAEALPLVMLVGQNEEAQAANLPLIVQLRELGYRVRMDLNGKSMKAQMKAAGRQQARWVLIRGESELEAQTIQIRDMESGEQREVPFADIAKTLNTHW